MICISTIINLHVGLILTNYALLNLEVLKAEQKIGADSANIAPLIVVIYMTFFFQEGLISERRRHRSNDLIPGEHHPPSAAPAPPLGTTGTTPTGVMTPAVVVEAQDHLTALLSESHNISHRHNRVVQPPVDKGEEYQGITAGLGM